jgi:hypothetical protein
MSSERNLLFASAQVAAQYLHTSVEKIAEASTLTYWV